MVYKLLNNKFAYTIILLLAITTRLSSQQVVGNKHFYEKEQIHFFALKWNNPASMFNYPSLSFTDAYVGMLQKKDNELYIAQEGNSFYSKFFEANSYVKNNKDAFYGSAKYGYSTRKNVKWNTVSDYHLFAPYVMADSIGGSSHKETYMFKGGYSTKVGKLILGIESSYRASLEYRNIDPRPKNSTSDFSLSGGVLLNLNLKYKLGLNLAFRKYKQTNNVKSIREGTRHKMFYMRGFGISEQYFSSANQSESNFYDLKVYRLQLSYTPLKLDGIYILTDYSKKYFEFIYSNTLGVIADMNSNILKTEIGYKVSKENKIICGKLHGEIQLRKGLEYNYNENLVFLNKLNKYNQELLIGGVSILKSVEKKLYSSFVILSADYKIDNSEYISPNAKQDISKLISSMTYGIQKPLKRSVLSAKVKFTYDKTLNKKQETNNLTIQVNKAGFRSNYEYLSASSLNFRFDSRYDYKLSDATTVFMGTDIAFKKYANFNTASYFSIKGGITF